MLKVQPIMSLILSSKNKKIMLIKHSIYVESSYQSHLSSIEFFFWIVQKTVASLLPTTEVWTRSECMHEPDGMGACVRTGIALYTACVVTIADSPLLVPKTGPPVLFSPCLDFLFA